MVSRISHVGVAVKDLAAATDVFRRLLGKEPAHAEDLPAHKVRTAMFDLGESSLELTEGMGAESPIAKFIEKRGEGIHHVSLTVDDIERELVRLRNEGFELIDEKPRRGVDGYLVAFLHPKSTNGVLIEISQAEK